MFNMETGDILKSEIVTDISDELAKLIASGQIRDI
jgi:hypothetical protein